MFRKKCDEAAIPDDIVEDILDRILPVVTEEVVKRLSKQREEDLKQMATEVGKVLTSFQKKIDEVSKELNLLKSSSGITLEKVMRDLLSAHNFAISTKAAQEVVEQLGLERLLLLNSYISEMESKVDELYTSTEELNKALLTLKTTSNTILSELRKEKEDLNKLKKELRLIPSEVSKDFEEKMSEALENIQKSFSIDAIDVSGLIRESVEAIFKEKLVEIEQRIYEATQNMQSIAESVSGIAVLAERLSALEDTLSVLVTKVNESKKQKQKEESEGVMI